MAADDLHHDLPGEMDFDPRQKMFARYTCRYNESEGEGAVVWREIVVATSVVRSVVKAVAHCHPLDGLDGMGIQFGPRSCAATVGNAAPWVNARVLETPFPSLAWVTRRITAKNWPALKVSWAFKVG